MNVYEEAHNLAHAIKESNEFIEFDRLRKEIEEDEVLKDMLKDLQGKQMEMQLKSMSGEEVGSEMMEQVQSLMAMIATKPKAGEYLQAEARFSVMMKDVYDILSDIIDIQM